MSTSHNEAVYSCTRAFYPPLNEWVNILDITENDSGFYTIHCESETSHTILSLKTLDLTDYQR